MVYLKKVLELSVEVYVYLWFHIRKTEARRLWAQIYLKLCYEFWIFLGYRMKLFQKPKTKQKGGQKGEKVWGESSFPFCFLGLETMFISVTWTDSQGIKLNFVLDLPRENWTLQIYVSELLKETTWFLSHREQIQNESVGMSNFYLFIVRRYGTWNNFSVLCVW